MQGWFHRGDVSIAGAHLDKRPHRHPESLCKHRHIKYHDNHPEYYITDDRNVMRRNNAMHRMNTTFCTLHYYCAGISRKPGGVQSTLLQGEASRDVQ